MNDEQNTRLNIDREIRILEIKAGIIKVVFGTSIVGVAAAFFPFAQETARAKFEHAISTQNANIGQAQDNRDFLESLKHEARSRNLEERIILAEFYSHIPSDKGTRERWEKFLVMLTEQRDAARKAELEENGARAALLKVTEEEKKASNAALIAEQLRTSAAVGGDAPVLAGTFSGLLTQLESSDTAMRRAARTELAGLGTGLVRPAMGELLSSDLSYRSRMGLVVALTEMLRDNKRFRSDIITLIDDDALTEMLRLATSDDYTIRVYAGEFLYDLGDPRVFTLAPEVWFSDISDNGRFNIALAMKGAAPFVAVSDRAQASSLAQSWIGKVGPKTDDLLRDVLGFLGRE